VISLLAGPRQLAGAQLSGGERNRLLLARLFARPANVLVLDEPTNDLDIDTLELLEDLLQKYDGTVFLVSHDRTFLDNVVTSTIAFEGDGALARVRMRRAGLARPVAPGPGHGGRTLLQISAQSKIRQRWECAQKPTPRCIKRPLLRRAVKLSYKEQRELDALPGRIEALEKEQQGIAATAGRWQRCTATHAQPRQRPWPSDAARSTMSLLAALERWESPGRWRG
jgi:ATP-binding cassette subfamily F protein uup